MNRNINDKYVVGKVELSFGECEIAVFRLDGKIPHFHIIGINKEIAMCIFDHAYYNHDRKYTRLEDSDLKILNDFLSSKSKLSEYTEDEEDKNTYWEEIRSSWFFVVEIKCEHKNDCMNYSQPDYTKTGYNDRYERRYIV